MLGAQDDVIARAENLLICKGRSNKGPPGNAPRGIDHFEGIALVPNSGTKTHR
jgi:hypothetical protein